ncbi:MAG: FUSC family protein [Bryobacteraceae bacterium]
MMVDKRQQDQTETLSRPRHSVKPSPWVALWRLAIRFDKAKVTPWIGARNAMGVALPLVAGILAGHTGAGLVMATGALNVSYSDGNDVYDFRARRMLISSVLCALAVFAGALTAEHGVLIVLLVTAFAFLAGLLVALGNTAGDLGVIALVTLVVYGAQVMSPYDAALSGLLALAGGLMQTAISLSTWPVLRYEPLRRAIANLYVYLGKAAASPVQASQAPPASAQSTFAQESVSRLGIDHTPFAERYRSLLNQAERIRISLLTLGRLRRRIERENAAFPDASRIRLELIDSFLGILAGLLTSIGECMLGNKPVQVDQASLERLVQIAEQWRQQETPGRSAFLTALVEDTRYQMDALLGQLRSAAELATITTPAGSAELAKRESRQPWPLRLRGRLAILRANLSLDSAAFRHAVRLAVCVGLGEALGRSFELRRSYWLPMTIAIVLKPDFSATFSRGVLRLAGTFLGLVVATGLYHLLPLSPANDVALITLLVFIARSIGPANYGVFVTAISALVVYLFALLGVAPKDVIDARAVNTVIGGALALLAYGLWPTWERTQVAETLARMLYAYRGYFEAVVAWLVDPEAEPSADLDQKRVAARLARSNMEASFERLSAEPGVARQQIDLIGNMLASSHRLVHAMMALEAAAAQTTPVAARPQFLMFSDDVEKTLSLLATRLRGGKAPSRSFPDLRQSYQNLVSAGDSHIDRYALVNVESDRVTNSLNTLAELVREWTVTRKGTGSSAAEPAAQASA